MAKPVIVTRAGKGTALSIAEGDANFTNLQDATYTFVGDAGTPQVIDLNGSLTIAGGTGVTTTASTGSVSVALDDTAVTPGSYTSSNITVDAQGRITTAADGNNTINGLDDVAIGTVTGPLVDNQVLVWASGVSSWVNASSPNISSVVEDTTPQLGGELDGQGNVVSNVTLKNYKETVHALGTTDAPAIDVANGNVQTVTITAGLALPLFTAAEAGESVTLLVTGTGTATGAAGYIFAGGATTLTTNSIVSIFYDGTNYWTSISADYQ